MFETYQHRCREKTSNNFHLEDVVYCGGRTVFGKSLKRSAAKIMTREALGSSFDSKLSRVTFIIAVNSSQSASFRNNITVGKMTFYQFPKIILFAKLERAKHPLMKLHRIKGENSLNGLNCK